MLMASTFSTISKLFFTQFVGTWDSSDNNCDEISDPFESETLRQRLKLKPTIVDTDKIFKEKHLKDKLKKSCYICTNSINDKTIACKCTKRKRNDSSSSVVSYWLDEEDYTMTGWYNRPKGVVHHSTDSLLSSSSGFSDFGGLINCALLLLTLSNARAALENIMKYGILMDPIKQLDVLFHQPMPCLLLVIGLNIFILISFGVERLLAQGVVDEVLGVGVILCNLISVLFSGGFFVYVIHPNPIFGGSTLLLYTIVFLKLWSYSHVTYWCRSLLRDKNFNRRWRRKSVHIAQDSKDPSLNANDQHFIPANVTDYPFNLTLCDLYYYLVTPTLCYELNFPRCVRIRKRFLFKRLVEVILLSELMVCLIQQWMVPGISNAMFPFQEMQYSVIVERLLKLCVPNHIIWLIFFYWFFHSFLNAVGEITRFADREFYRDWWNAHSVDYFWKNWNIPVHRFAVRHIYKPLRIRGFNRLSSSVAVFFISAFFHEYLVSIPLRMMRLWAFLAMLGQIPMAMFSSRFLTGRGANITVWLSLILGQPAAIMMYCHDYYVYSVQGYVFNSTVSH